MRTVAVPLFWLFWHHCNMPVSQMQLDIHPLSRSLLLQGSESLLHLCNYVLSRQLFNTTAWLAWSQLPWPLNPLQLLIGHSTRQLTTWTLHDKLPRSVMYSFLSVISLYLLFSWLCFMFMQVLNTKNIQALHTCVCVHRFLSYSESLYDIINIDYGVINKVFHRVENLFFKKQTNKQIKYLILVYVTVRDWWPWWPWVE